MKKIIWSVFTISALIIVVIVAVKINTSLSTMVAALFINFISGLVGFIANEFWNNSRELKLIFQCCTKYRHDKIRVSISYLYRIKVDRKYLLVKSKRITDQYQPVGGVYKTYASANSIMQDLKVATQSGYNDDEDLRNDLRVKLPSKNLHKIIQWFETRKDRELDPIREFYEELIVPEILDKDIFAYFDYHFIEQIRTNIKYSNHFSCNEILIYNIYELLPNSTQNEELRRTMQTKNNEFKWFSYEEIECLGNTENGDFRIGEHTLYTL